MSSLPVSNEDIRQKLQQARNRVLALHKALLDSERTSYEIACGPIPSPAAFLQLLINDPWFSWLQPMTKLIVEIDEALAARKPVDTPVLEQLLVDTRSLLSPSRNGDDSFWKRYSTAVRRDPAVTLLHEQLETELGWGFSGKPGSP